MTYLNENIWIEGKERALEDIAKAERRLAGYERAVVDMERRLVGLKKSLIRYDELIKEQGLHGHR